MEDRKKKVIILASIIAILIILILLGIKLIFLKNNDKTIPVNNNQKVNNVIEKENIIQKTEPVENKLENTVNEIIPEENEESIEEEKPNKSEPIADSEQEIDKETMEKMESDEEKALRIAKDNWQQGDNVNFTHEGIENGEHVVYVRDFETRHIATYRINVETGTFKKE